MEKSPEQNVCVALPVGAPGVVLTTAVTSSLDIAFTSAYGLAGKVMRVIYQG